MTHEAPSCHRYGVEALDVLAKMMGAQCIFHGHHHAYYKAHLESGIKVCGAHLQGVVWAFNLQRGAELKQKWDMIEEDTDVLITHGPLFCYLDSVVGDEHVGCEELTKAVQRIKPKLHVCGHIHGGYGVDKVGPTRLVNASTCTEHYDPINEPIVLDVKGGSA